MEGSAIDCLVSVSAIRAEHLAIGIRGTAERDAELNPVLHRFLHFVRFPSEHIRGAMAGIEVNMQTAGFVDFHFVGIHPIEHFLDSCEIG